MIARLTFFAVLFASCTGDIPDSSAAAGAAGTADTAGEPVLGYGSVATEASDTAGAVESRSDSLLLTPDGWGPLRIGMSRAEVVAAAGEDANPDAVGGPDPERCDQFRPADAPAGMLVMIENGVLTRISVSRNTDIETPAGFSVGDSGEGVVEEYGARAQVEPHEYQAPPARYITVWQDASPGGERRGIRYEVDSSGSVVRLSAGGASIEYVEGCL